jgi:hypothetical protein
MTIKMGTSILKLVGILVVFLGCVLFSQVLCQIHTRNGALYKPLVHAYYFPVAVCVWGSVLYLLSSVLGKIIATD